jgi:hypothetical protein
VFGVAYFFVRALHIVAYAVLARGDAVLREALFRLARTILPAPGVLGYRLGSRRSFPDVVRPPRSS